MVVAWMVVLGVLGLAPGAALADTLPPGFP